MRTAVTTSLAVGLLWLGLSSGLAGCTGSDGAANVAPTGLPATVADQWRGKVVVADFWATWCGPCRASSPNVQALHDRFASDTGVLIVGVHADDNVENPKAYIDEHGYTYPIIEKGETVADAFGVNALPTFVVLDAQGREVMRHVGMMDQKTRDKIAAKVAELRG